MSKKSPMDTACEGEKLLNEDVRGARVAVRLRDGTFQSGTAIGYGTSDVFGRYLAIGTVSGATIFPIDALSYVTFFHTSDPMEKYRLATEALLEQTKKEANRIFASDRRCDDDKEDW